MTQAEAADMLKALGVRRQFRPEIEPETGALLLKVRKPAAIRDGFLIGSEIALHAGGVFHIWTPRKKKARALAQAHGLRLRLMDGEAELYLPAVLADAILPTFGAKVRRELSPERREALTKRLAEVRQRPEFEFLSPVERPSTNPNPQRGTTP